MRFVKMLTAAVPVVSLMLVPAYAGQRGNSGGHGPSTTHGPSATSHGPSTTHGRSTTTSGASSTTTGTSTSTGTVDFSASPVAQKLSKNTALTSKLETRLKALGYTGTLDQAAYGFKNVGQLVAATNVSQNLGIPFEQLKVQMTGLSVDASGNVLRANLAPDGSVTMVDPAKATSPAPSKSLGQSIQTLKSGVDGSSAAQTATRQANAEIQSTSTTTSNDPAKKSHK